MMDRFCILFLAAVLMLPGIAASGMTTSVKWVVDGDTIVIENGQHVRYIGIDAPEVAHKHKKAEPFGYKARALNRKLVMNQRIRLEFGKERTDRYQRLLAYVFNEKGAFVNKEMLRNGYAHVYFHKTNMEKKDVLLKAQRAAMKQGRGKWRILVQQKDRDDLILYVGHTGSMRFHRLTCPFGKKIARRNKRRFKGQFNAFWEGFAPCSRCISP